MRTPPLSSPTASIATVSDEESPRVKNVVVLFHVTDGAGLAKHLLSLYYPPRARFTRNFYNFKSAPFSYTVFPRSGLVIATGISAKRFWKKPRGAVHLQTI